MKYIKFGKNKQKVSVLGLGLAALGRPAYINSGRREDIGEDRGKEVLKERTLDLLNYALKNNINYFDMARSYGDAESFFSEWYSENHPEDIFVSSKWGYEYTGNWDMNAKQHEKKDHSLSTLTRQYSESKKNLGEALNLFQVHSLTPDSPVFKSSEIQQKLMELKSDGLLIGGSVSGDHQKIAIEKMLALELDGERLFDTVQVTYNLLETSAEKVMKTAHEEGMLVIAKEVLANGRLTTRNPEWKMTFPGKIFYEESEKLGASPEETAMAWVMAKDFVDIVLSGAVTVDQVKSNLKSLRISSKLKNIDILNIMQENPVDYWNIRSKLGWQ